MEDRGTRTRKGGEVCCRGRKKRKKGGKGESSLFSCIKKWADKRGAPLREDSGGHERERKRKRGEEERKEEIEKRQKHKKKV